MNKKRQGGFTLIEILLAVVFIALATGFLYSRYVRTQDTNRAKDFTDSVRELAVGCNESRVGNTYSGVNAAVLVRGGYAPDNLVNGNGLRHQYSSSIIVGSADYAGGTDNVCSMRWNAIPPDVCARAVNAAENQFVEIIVGSTTVKSDTVTLTSANLTTACAGGNRNLTFRTE